MAKFAGIVGRKPEDTRSFKCESFGSTSELSTSKHDTFNYRLEEVTGVRIDHDSSQLV